MSKRVLLAGLFHETHTFLDAITPLDQFTVRRGDELNSARGDGSPLSGVLQVAEESGWEVIPTIDLRATPSATVSDEVLDLFWEGFSRIAEQEIPRGIDGIDLVLHGAMVSETLLDVEGEIIERIRSLPGAGNIPICGVLDLHGNISRRTMASTQGMVSYRNNPHTDSCEASMRAARLLERIMTTGESPVAVWEQPPIMWPPTGTGTSDDPMKTLEAMARQIEKDHPEIVVVNVFGGFSFADTPETGISFSAFTFGDAETAHTQLRELSDWADAHKKLGNVVDPPLESVMPEIAKRAKNGEGPIAVVEPADNVGGGAPGDATTILKALLDHNVEHAAVVINDPETVTALQSVSLGETATVSVGGKGSRLTDGPLELNVTVLNKSDGRFDLEDRNSHLASMSGIHINMGPCATVKHKGVSILLTSRKTPPFDLGQLRSQGIEPERCSVIGIKAAVAHRRAYDTITHASYTVSTPGPCTSDLKSFPWQHIRRPIFPLDD